LKAALEEAFPGVEVDLIKSKGGAFEIRRETALVYSKKKTGRFPSNAESIAALRSG
jgi:selT/selW/selH-like putative selenoprotein